MAGVRYPAGAVVVLYSPNLKPALGPTQPLLSSGYQELFHRGMKLTTHLKIVGRLRRVELILHSPLCLQGLMLN
jgi:hypothetical protein